MGLLSKKLFFKMPVCMYMLRNISSVQRLKPLNVYDHVHAEYVFGLIFKCVRKNLKNVEYQPQFWQPPPPPAIHQISLDKIVSSNYSYLNKKYRPSASFRLSIKSVPSAYSYMKNMQKLTGLCEPLTMSSELLDLCSHQI